MFHHASLCVPHPASAAAGLAALLGGDVLRAPCPPLPTGSWLVALRDQVGSLVEVLPADTVSWPDGINGLARMEANPGWPQSHCLFSTPLSQARIDATARTLGWSHQRGDAGLFAFTKVWVQNHVLIELMTPSQARQYCRRFGLGERPLLDARLRRLERTLHRAAQRWQRKGSATVPLILAEHRCGAKGLPATGDALLLSPAPSADGADMD